MKFDSKIEILASIRQNCSLVPIAAGQFRALRGRVAGLHYWFHEENGSSFFELLKRNSIEQLIDVRLNNVSQLAGFSKRDDLRYFLKEICDAEYLHEPLFAPTQPMLDAYKKSNSGWDEYAQRFLELMASRHIESAISPLLFDRRSVLLCSELKAEHCHRKLVLDYLQSKWNGIEVVHL